MSPKAVATFAPFMNAVLYGLYYALSERNYQKLPLSTVTLISAVTSLILLLILTTTKAAPLDFSFIQNKQSLGLVLAAQAVSLCIAIMMYLAMRYTSATYLAFGELGYPLFVIIFAYVLFGNKELNWQVAIGGLFIIVGCSVLLYGRTKI